ncbi:MAG: thioredoxin domain-containing protein [Pyrinomonadaceae bacterium]
MKRYLPFVIIIGVLIISTVSGMLLYRRSTQPATTTDASSAQPAANPAHVRGETSAPVTIEEFADFQCPPCGMLHPEMKKIETEYGSRLKVVFRQFPVVALHKHALQAAHAAEAAGLQGRFWEMHDMLFDTQSQWDKADDVRPIFSDFARSLNLDVQRFNTDMDGTEVSKRILEDQDRARVLRVKGTPTVFINGRLIQPAQFSPEGLRAAIDAALREKGL